MQDAVFRVVTMCNDVAGYEHFRGPCCLYSENELYSVEFLSLKKQHTNIYDSITHTSLPWRYTFEDTSESIIS